ncbi:MAG: nuclear transport factor 2 family protein [Solirubrobacterales bacterium]|nr:nuclear transport factor 2 family protein [Solirubrobacterales bacterium]
MSSRDQELIAILRHALDAGNRGDFDTAVAMVTPDVELISRGGFTSLRGADALRAWLEPKTMEDVLFEVEDIEVVGSNVLARHRVRGRGVASGISLEMRFWAVWTFNEARLLTRVVMFRPDEAAAAREAAGLSE